MDAGTWAAGGTRPSRLGSRRHDRLALSGFYTVGPNEVGLNRIFGRYTGKTGPGFNYNLPIPIGSVEKLQVTDRNTINIGFGFRQERARNGQARSTCPKRA